MPKLQASPLSQKLSQYYFQIDYCQGKANAAVDTLSRFLQRSQSEDEELRAENIQILHRLQSSLTNASLLGFNLLSYNIRSQIEGVNLLPLYQVLICGTYVLPWVCQFWEKLRGELTSKKPYKQTSIRGLRFRLPELQTEDQVAREIRK